jgi:hypothetical protein
MTRKALAQLIYDTVDNGKFTGEKEKDLVNYISDILEVLEPKDIEKFANWGNAEQHSTPEKCWK